MRVMVIGGHGKVALLAAPLLAAGGHDVRSVVRNAEHVADVEAAGATAVVADVEHLDQTATRALVRGSDVIVWSAGAGGGDPARTYAVDRDAAIRVIDAAVAEGVRRFVMVSYVGSGRDNVPEDNPFHAYATAKAAADEHLRRTALDWTILGPGQLTPDEPTGRIEYGDHIEEGATSRGNVAEVIAGVVARSDLGGLMIRFCDGTVSVAQAMDSLARR